MSASNEAESARCGAESDGSAAEDADEDEDEDEEEEEDEEEVGEKTTKAEAENVVVDDDRESAI